MPCWGIYSRWNMKWSSISKQELRSISICFPCGKCREIFWRACVLKHLIVSMKSDTSTSYFRHHKYLALTFQINEWIRWHTYAQILCCTSVSQIWEMWSMLKKISRVLWTSKLLWMLKFWKRLSYFMAFQLHPFIFNIQLSFLWPLLFDIWCTLEYSHPVLAPFFFFFTSNANFTRHL